MNAPGYEANELLPQDYLTLDLSDEVAILNNNANTYAQNVENLIDRLDIILSAGRLTSESRTNIINAVMQIPQTESFEKIAKGAIYLIMISPDYSHK